MNTPTIIKFSFWKMVSRWPDAAYACLNYGEACAPDEIRDRSICINGDIREILMKLSVFGKDTIHGVFAGMKGKKLGLFGIIPACLLGIASPLCMYGTIPLLQQWLWEGMSLGSAAAFMINKKRQRHTSTFSESLLY